MSSVDARLQIGIVALSFRMDSGSFLNTFPKPFFSVLKLSLLLWDVELDLQRGKVQNQRRHNKAKAPQKPGSLQAMDRALNTM